MNKLISKITSLEQCEEIFILQNKYNKDFGENIWKTDELYDLITNKKLHGFINSSNERIIAFCIFKKIDDFIEIYSIFVHPLNRKEGIGKKIINHCIEYCTYNDLKKIILDVNVTNLIAINLYKKSGFIFCGKRKDYYQNSNSTDDSFSMSLILSDIAI
ncbi:MAG: GNAT family N-acetyltransferase [Alphaproteobacteria bacterium]